MDAMLNDGLEAMRHELRRTGREPDPRARLQCFADLALRCSVNNRARAIALLWYAIEVDPAVMKIAFAPMLDRALGPALDAAKEREDAEARA